MNKLFDKIFVINLKERKDRWEVQVKEFERMGIVNYERFDAIKPDVSKLPKEWYNNLVSPHKFKEFYIQAAIGCKWSQYEIIKIAKERGYKRILICEDDVVFTYDKEKTDEILEEVMKEIDELGGFHMIYFSGNHNSPPLNIGKKYLYKVLTTLTTHAYCLDASIFDYMIDTMMKVGCEIDNYYIHFIHRQFQKSYTIKPGLATQAPSYSDVLQRVVDYRDVIS